MDEPTPVLEVSTAGHSDSAFSMTRDDVTRECPPRYLARVLFLKPYLPIVVVFLDTIAQIERATSSYSQPPVSPRSPDEPRVGSLGEDGTVVSATAPTHNSQHGHPHPLKEVRAAMDKLIGRMEGLGAEFDKLVERSGK